MEPTASKEHLRSEKGFVACLLICFFLGLVGGHRFYVGKTGTGLLMLCTLGGFLVWAVVDFLVVACGNFTDAQGRWVRPA